MATTMTPTSAGYTGTVDVYTAPQGVTSAVVMVSVSCANSGTVYRFFLDDVTMDIL